MNQEKFRKKTEELVEYEEQVLRQAQEFWEGKQEELEKLGLKGCSQLFWLDFESGNDDIPMTRIPFKKGYTCQLSMQICKKEDDPFDPDLECVSDIQRITMICEGAFASQLKFDKFDAQEYIKCFQETYESVLKNGYEATFASLTEVQEKDIPYKILYVLSCIPLVGFFIALICSWMNVYRTVPYKIFGLYYVIGSLLSISFLGVLLIFYFSVFWPELSFTVQVVSCICLCYVASTAAAVSFVVLSRWVVRCYKSCVDESKENTDQK